jgi:hypothetical protein
VPLQEQRLGAVPANANARVGDRYAELERG